MKKTLLMLLTSGIILGIVMSAFSVAAQDDSVSDENGNDSDDIAIPPIPPAEKPEKVPTEAPCGEGSASGEDDDDKDKEDDIAIPPIPPFMSLIMRLLALR
jgi:hypothetical protein